LASLRDKLFFFYAQDYEPDKTPGVLAQFTMPTAAERTGDFSQSVRSDGSHYDIYDPTTCTTASGTQVCQQFPNDIIPSSRIDPTLQKLLSIFPLPNFTNRAASQGNYNYVVQTQITSPARQENLRFDYAPTEKLKVYFRFTDLNNDATGKSEPAIHANWQKGNGFYETNAKTYAANVTYILSPHLVNELVAGVNFWYETGGADATALQQFSKTAQGINIPQLYPANNPENFLPAVSFGTIPNSPGYTYDGRFPLSNVTIAPSVSDGLSVVYGSHNMKFGIYGDNAAYEQRHQSGSGQFSGEFTFTGANSSNPNNAGYPYSEVLLGDFDQYTEPTSRPTSYGVLSTLEWYGQDSWRATKKLTLEYGIRFTYDIPETLKNHQGALLDFSKYSAASAAQLYVPVSTTQTENPNTGEIYPFAYQDHFIPGSGNTSPGAVLANSPNFEGFFKSEGVLLVPRVGFAYDVFGNGKTALRGGFGMFTNPLLDQDDFENVTFNPPEIFYPTQYYGNVNTLTSSQGLISPSSFTTYDHAPHRPQNINMTLGLQQEIGFGTVLDAAYVGVLGRHNLYYTNLNEVPYGAEFLPAHQYPGTSSPLPDDYYRPYPGYSTIDYGAWGDNSVYHSLQVQLKRSFSHGLHFGVAYTWSKLIDDNKGATYLPYTLFRGVTSGDQPQRVVINYLWNIPKASRVWNNVVTRRVLDDWQLSGITTFNSGGPTSVSLSTTDGQNITGGGDGAYVTQTGPAEIGRGQRNFFRYFNTSVYQRTPQFSIGNGFRPQFYGPGSNDFDMAVNKNIPLGKVTMQLRAEAYNIFNHTQFNSVDNSAVFAPDGSQTNGDFGRINGAGDPRIMQLAGRISF
jgi:hypothetical protein